jgi:hypothetical protein
MKVTGDILRMDVILFIRLGVHKESSGANVMKLDSTFSRLMDYWIVIPA